MSLKNKRKKGDREKMKPTPIVLKVLNWISLVLLAIATYLTIYWAPQEVTMGNVQRVFYFHVATGWVGMIGFLLAVFSGIMYLRTFPW
jgi:heme exporter protein C